MRTRCIQWFSRGLWSCILLLGLMGGVSAHAAAWGTDLSGALRQAATEKKLVLVNFTGSDWCPYCIKLHNEVFDRPEFSSYVDGRFLLVEVDFPRRKQLPAKQQAANNELQARYGIQGFPTVLILNGAGKEVGKLGYFEGGLGPFMSELKRQSGVSGPAVAQAAPPAAPAAAPRAGAKGNAPAAPLNAAPELPKQLTLKGVIGSKQNPMAIINSKTLAVGDQATIKLEGGALKVRCLEIGDGVVSVAVEGEKEPRQLRMAVSR